MVAEPTWMQKLRFGVAKVLIDGVEFPWRGKLNFKRSFVATDNPTLEAIDVSFSLAPGAVPGQIAVVDGTGLDWVPGVPAEVLRSGYDFSLTDESVPNDGAGTAWQTLMTWTRAQLAAVDGTTLAVTFDIRVTEDEFGANDPKDEVTAVFVYTRRDAYSDTITNKISGATATSATPSVEADSTLPAAAAADAANALLKVRLRRGSGGTSENIYFEALQHVSQDRKFDVEVFLGRAW